jgi:hypothetical protein
LAGRSSVTKLHSLTTGSAIGFFPLTLRGQPWRCIAFAARHERVAVAPIFATVTLRMARVSLTLQSASAHEDRFPR